MKLEKVRFFEENKKSWKSWGKNFGKCSSQLKSLEVIRKILKRETVQQAYIAARRS